MSQSLSSASAETSYDDSTVRRRIGPWSETGVPDLSAFDPDTNFFVRAAAGSGKTTALVARMVALVRTGVPAEEIAAITFTRKAAGEMSKRFFEELRRVQRALPNGTEQRRHVTAALQNAQQTFIGTVHAFCARLLRERPLAADLPPDFTAGLEDRDERRLRERAWQRYLQRMRDERPDRIQTLTDLGVEPGDLENYFERLCEHPELEPYVNAPDQVPDMDEAVAEAKRRLMDWQQHRPDDLTDGRDDAMKAFDRAEKRLAYLGVDTPAQKAAFLEIFTDVSTEEQADVTLKCWRGPDTDSSDWARALRDEHLPRLVREVIQPVLRQWRAYVHREVVEFVQPAVQTFSALRTEEGMLTFHDLLLHTRDLLRDHPGLRERIQERYPRLLVDEFQDTDPLQAEILFYLTSRDPTETEWTECQPRPGSLFIVGDDKQSIYRFRRADMKVFESVGRLIENSGGEAVTLTKNFRSLSAICDWCDETFSSIFADPTLEDLQAPYTPFDPQRPKGRSETGLRRIEIDKVSGNRGEDIAREDARRIARFIRAARHGNLETDFYGEEDEEEAVFAGGVDYSDFLILTRTKTRLSVYARVLAEHGVPYTITGSEDLGDSAELKAIVDLMTCALRPDDEVASVAYLKGPLVGASDEDLYRYTRAGGEFGQMHESIPDSVLEGLDEERRALFAGAFKRLRRARRRLRETRPSVALERIVGELGLLAGAAHPASSSEGSLRAGHVLRTITYVQDLTDRGLSWAEVLDELRRIIDAEEEVDGMTLETGSEDAVRVMNVHQAKGLEAPVVFLADPYSSGGGRKVTRHLRRTTGELVAPIVQGKGYYQQITHPPLGWEERDEEEGFRAREERHEEAEERRLLYVAATRAQKLLVVSTYPEKPEDGYWAPLYPHLTRANVPELEAPALEEVSRREVAPAPRLQDRRSELRRRLKALRRPSYREETVTGAKTGRPAAALQPGAEGHGENFGTAVHVLLELCVQMRHEDPRITDEVVRAVLEREGAEATPEQVDRAKTMIERFLASRIWEALQEADPVYTEYPVARRGAAENTTSVVRRGVIDLAYRRRGQWVLVDYKSDHVEESAAKALSEQHPYVQQIRTYAEDWKSLWDAPVEAGLWFADSGTHVPVISS